MAAKLHDRSVMIDLYTFNVPSGHKASIALEELGLEYEIHWVDITTGEQHEEWFQQICPSEKIPAIVDRDGPGGKPLAVMDAGPILLYLADKTGQLLAADPRTRSQTIQWLFFHQPDELGVQPQALKRHEDEARRLLSALERRLGESGSWLAGEYSIADIATAPWIDTLETTYGAENLLPLDQFEHVQAWRERFAQRPAVIKGRQVVPERAEKETTSGRARKNSATRRRSQRPVATRSASK